MQWEEMPTSALRRQGCLRPEKGTSAVPFFSGCGGHQSRGERERVRAESENETEGCPGAITASQWIHFSLLCTCLWGPTVCQAALWSWGAGGGQECRGRADAVLGMRPAVDSHCKHSAVGVTGELYFLRSIPMPLPPRPHWSTCWAGLSSLLSNSLLPLSHYPESLLGLKTFLASVYTSLSLNKWPKTWWSVGCSWSHKCAFQ